MSQQTEPTAIDGVTALSTTTTDAWRSWLKTHGQTERKIWVLARYAASTLPGMRMNEAIAHALCYGWTDNRLHKLNDDTFYICFMPRNPKSVWGSKYRQLAEKMIAEGLMQPAGQAFIDHAKEIKTWDSMDDPINTTIPDDLQQLFDKDAAALKNFEAFPKSSKRWIFQWIAAAKRPETRTERVNQTAELAALNLKAHHPEAKEYLAKLGDNHA